MRCVAPVSSGYSRGAPRGCKTAPGRCRHHTPRYFPSAGLARTTIAHGVDRDLFKDAGTSSSSSKAPDGLVQIVDPAMPPPSAPEIERIAVLTKIPRISVRRLNKKLLREYLA